MNFNTQFLRELGPNYTEFCENIEPSSLLSGVAFDYGYVAPFETRVTVESKIKAKFGTFDPAPVKLGENG